MATSDQGRDTVGYQTELIRMCRETFERCLVPSTVMDNMTLDPNIKERILAHQRLERQEAVRLLLEIVLARPEDHVSMFVYALKEAGFEHFTDILEDSKGPQDRNRTSAKYEMLILWLQGDLKDKIIPTEIIDDLKPILSDRDYDLIRNLETERSTHDACQELFLAMPRKTPRWASYFLDALYNAYGRQLLGKIHPDLTHDVGVDEDEDEDEDEDSDDGEDESDNDSSQSEPESVSSMISFLDLDSREDNDQPNRHADLQGHMVHQADSQHISERQVDPQGHPERQVDSRGHTERQDVPQGHTELQVDIQHFPVRQVGPQNHRERQLDPKGHPGRQVDSLGHQERQVNSQGHQERQVDSQGLQERQVDSQGHQERQVDSQGHQERQVDSQGHKGVARYSRHQLLALRPRSALPHIISANIPRECSLEVDTPRYHRESATIPELRETGVEEQTLRKKIQPSSQSIAVSNSDSSDDAGSQDGDQETDVIYSRQEVEMRHYQLELAANALAGRNNIIFAPTGSGKTMVAIYIAKCILQKERGKVIFLEPTVALVNQTYVEVRRYLGDTYKVMKLRGVDDDSVNLHMLLPYNDIAVMTPMILENHLKQEKIECLSGLCRLLVLDECHHTRKGEAYNQIMIRYLREKEEEAQHLPQIVGLTAALGVEKASTEDEALNNILRLCANLDPHSPIISTVLQNKEELARLVPFAEEQTIPLKENKNSQAKTVIEDAMARIQDMLPSFQEMQNEIISKCLREAPDDFGSQLYNQWTKHLMDTTTKVNTQGDAEQTEIIRKLSSIADHLYKYNVALTLNDLVRVKDVIDYISKELLANVHTVCEQQLQNEANKVKKDLMRCELKRRQDRDNENPRLNQLVDILVGLMKDAPDFRAIIFAQTRATCGALADWLNTDVHVPDVLRDLNASFFTGANAREQMGGMTQTQQDNVLADFRSGRIRLIVATSVGNEGIDIPDCNVIVPYNHTGNEITTLQVRGRSRKVGGRTVNLADDKVQERNCRNLVKEYLMQHAVDTITQMPYDRVSKLIRLFQQEVLVAAEISERGRQADARQSTNLQYCVICKHCRTELTTGEMMRVINGSQYVVVDKTFTYKITSHVPTQINGQLKFDNVVMAGGISCRDCHKPLGSRILVSGVVFYTLGIKYVLFLIDGTEEPQKFKQWSKVPFRPRAMSTDDHLDYNRL